MLAADPRRVPAARLRRFFFDRVEPWPDGRLARAADLAEGARAALNGANPWARERALRLELECTDADAVALRADLCCTSWERALLHALGSADGAIVPQFVPVMAPLVARVCALEPDDRPPFWRGAVLPRAALKEPDESVAAYAQRLADAGLALWAVATWRVAAARVLEDALDLRPADDGAPTPQSAEHDALALDFRLLRDTHLELLALAARTRCFSDEALAAAMIDTALYPGALCALSAGELPDMMAVLALVNIWYDSGIRKSREDVREAVAHVFCKMMNQKCQMRDLRKLVLDYADRYPAFNRLFKLMLQVALLGNFPRAEAPLDWAARVRVACLFRAETASTPLSRSCFGPWMRVALYPLMFALREVLVYAIDRHSVLADVMNESMRWYQHTRIVRAANGDMRRVLSHQAAFRPGAPWDWSQLQRTELNSNGKPKKVGITMRYHDAGLKANSKMRKAPFEAIILKEMTSCHTLYGKRVAFDDAAALAELTRIDEALHFCAWAAARERAAVIPTRWLRVLGMTAAGYERVRRWVFEYYVYDVSDHGYVDELLALHAEDPLDWVRLRAYLIRVMQFRDEGDLFFLPIERYQSQMRALRERAHVDDWADTPEHLGVALRCLECDAWATPVVEPPVTINADGEATSAAHAGVKRRVATAANKDSAPDAFALTARGAAAGQGPGPSAEFVAEIDQWERDAALLEREDADEDDDDGVFDALEALQRDEDRKKATERLEKRVAQSMYLSAVWYDPVTDRLHCRRRHRHNTGPLAALYAQLDALAESDGESGDDDDDGDDAERAAPTAPRAPVQEDADPMEDDEDDEVRDMRALTVPSLASANKAALARIAALAERTAQAARPAATPVPAPAPDASAGALQRRADPVDAYLVRHYQRTYNRALTAYGMVGAWVTTRNGVFGLCDECGCTTRIENCRVTNRGVSCLHHVTSNMRDDNPVRLLLEARERRRAGVKAAPAASDTLALARPLGHKPVPVRAPDGALAKCFHCQRHVAEYQVLAYDRTAQLWRVPLCQLHYRAAQRTLQATLVPSAAALIDALVASRY